MAEPKAPTMAVEQMVRILGTTQEELRALSRRNRIPKIKDGRLEQAATVQAYCHHLRTRVVTTEEAGERMGVSGQMVRNIITDGYIQRTDGGGVEMDAAFVGYIRWLKDDARRSSKSASASRVQEARAKEIELRTAERRRELIPLEDAVGALDLVVGRCVTEMQGLPVRFTRDVPLRRKLEEEVDGCRRRIVASLRDARSALRAGGDIIAAAGEADA